MIRLATATAVFGLIVAACGGQVTEETFETVPPPGSTVATTEAPAVTDTGDPTTTAAPPVTSEPIVVDGPPAPDFSLALHDGLGFVLSAETKPVYMVFWAEW
jgi:hypothetical protein